MNAFHFSVRMTLTTVEGTVVCFFFNEKKKQVNAPYALSQSKHPCSDAHV